ncbi:MAG: nicotinamide riboside transporter PnuC [Candidatus Saccharimonas aalborgensis]
MKKLLTTSRVSNTRDIAESVFIGVILTTLSYVVGLNAGWVSSLNLLEIFAVFTSYSSTYLCVKERRANYPIGAISTAAYTLLFLQNGLLASAILNAYLTPTLIYGWIRWRKDKQTRPVTHVQPQWIPVYLAVAGVGYAGAALLSQQFGGTMAWTDSMILAATILAQFLLDNKKLENWVVWAVVNVFAIYTYATTGLPLVAFQYVFFLLNTMYGFMMWQRSKKITDTLPTHADTGVPMEA